MNVAVLHQVIGGEVLAGGGSAAIGRGVSNVVGALGRAGSSTALNGESSTVVVSLVAHVGVDAVFIVGRCVDSSVSEVSNESVAGDDLSKSRVVLGVSV